MTRLGTPDAATDTTSDPHGSLQVAAPGAVKSPAPQTSREFERAMCALGYSRRQAKAITQHGFKAIDKHVEPDTHAAMVELAAVLEKNLNLLKDSES